MCDMSICPESDTATGTVGTLRKRERPNGPLVMKFSEKRDSKEYEKIQQEYKHEQQTEGQNTFAKMFKFIVHQRHVNQNYELIFPTKLGKN
jgi:hypothetical protein